MAERWMMGGRDRDLYMHGVTWAACKYLAKPSKLSWPQASHPKPHACTGRPPGGWLQHYPASQHAAWSARSLAPLSSNNSAPEPPEPRWHYVESKWSTCTRPVGRRVGRSCESDSGLFDEPWLTAGRAERYSSGHHYRRASHSPPRLIPHDFMAGLASRHPHQDHHPLPSSCTIPASRQTATPRRSPWNPIVSTKPGRLS
jgi:hypothetical protein